MKLDESKLKILNSYVKVCENHAKKLEHALLETQHHVPFTPQSLEKINAVDSAFLEVVTSRFAKLQDTCGQKIFPLMLSCSGEDVSDKTFIDILNAFEKFGFIKDGSFWIELRRIRNAVAHEYPDNNEKLALDLNDVFRKSKELLKYWESLKDKINQLFLKKIDD